MNYFILFTIIVCANASSLSTALKINKFEIPPTTLKPNKDTQEEFVAHIHSDTDKLLSRKSQCIVINEFSVIEGKELFDCESSYIPINTKYTDADGTSHILPVFLGSDSNILEAKQNRSGICRKLRRY